MQKQVSIGNNFMISPRKKRFQSGSSITETMIALILMCLIFFGAMQLFQWAMARMFCDYSSFYAAKAHSLGYSYRTSSKAARIAAIPISGQDRNSLLKLPRKTLTSRLRLYMSSGNGGVDFPYWDAKQKEPNLLLYFSSSATGNTHLAGVILANAPYLSDGLKKFFKISNEPVNPYGYTYFVDHSNAWGR